MRPWVLVLVVLSAAAAVCLFVGAPASPTVQGVIPSAPGESEEAGAPPTLAARTSGSGAADGSAEPVAALPAPSATLEGRVVDRAGRGIPGARVYATCRSRGARGFYTLWRVDTDVDGHFQAGIPDVPDASFAAEAPGFRRGSFEVDPGGDHVVVPLWRAVSVRIHVQFEGRVPTDGSQLRLVLVGLEGQEDGFASVRDVTDGALVFESRTLGEGVHHLGLDGMAGFADAKIVTPATGVEEVVVAVRLDQGGYVGGVVRGIDGAPVEGAEISEISSDRWVGGLTANSARTDGGGRFLLTGLRGRLVRLRARFEGSTSESAAQVGSPDVGLRFAPDVVHPVPARPAPSAAVSGVVLDEEGRPVANAYITAMGGVGGEPWAQGTKSDTHGRFRVAAQPGDACRLQVYSLDPPGQADVSGIAPDSIGVALRLEAHATIRGRVIVAEGWLPAGTCVSAWREGEKGADKFDADYPSPDGRFAVERLARGRYRIAARAGALVGQAEAEVLVSPGEVSRRIVIRLREGAKIEGHVLDADERPVERATVRAEHPFYLHPDPLETDEAGRFHLDGLLPGPWTIHVEGFKDGAPAKAVVEVGDEGAVSVVVRLP